jgi:hypothetical protein
MTERLSAGAAADSVRSTGTTMFIPPVMLNYEAGRRLPAAIGWAEKSYSSQSDVSTFSAMPPLCKERLKVR